MSVLVGKKAPSFNANAVINGNEIVNNFNLDKFVGKKYVVFFFYTKDFSGISFIDILFKKILSFLK